MTKVNLDLSSGLYRSDNSIVADIILRNCYVNIPQTESPYSQANIFGTAGIKQVANTGAVKQVNRGAHEKAGVPYFVNGSDVYRLDRVVVDSVTSYQAVKLGSITGSSRVSMADNGKQLIIIDLESGDGWIIDESATPVFQKITDTDFKANGKPQHVDFVDSFFVVTTDSKKFIKSDANNGLSWNALDFGSAEKDPDDIVSLIVFKGELFIAGTKTIQSFSNIGGAAGAGFPFQASGLILSKGVYAPFSLINTNDSFMFIGGGSGESPAIWASNGGTVQKLSNTAIDSALSSYSQDSISNAFSWSYAIDGQYFVGFTFDEATFVINLTTNKWHEQTSKITDAKGFTSISRWRVNSMVFGYNKVFVGDNVDGRIGLIDKAVYSEYENEIIREFTTIPISVESNSFSVNEIEITVDNAIKFIGESSKIRLSWSDDGGKTYSNNIERTLGKIGEFTRRLIFRRLGRAPRFRIFKFAFSDKQKFSVAKIELNVTVHNG